MPWYCKEKLVDVVPQRINVGCFICSWTDVQQSQQSQQKPRKLQKSRFHKTEFVSTSVKWVKVHHTLKCQAIWPKKRMIKAILEKPN